MKEKLKKILDQMASIKKGKRLILGIDGLSRSGKTTLVKKFSEMLKEEQIPFYIFHIDDHIVVRNLRYNTGNDEWFEYYQLQWDIHGLREQLFERVKESNVLSLQYYQAETDTQIRKQIILPEACVVIIEGVFLQRKEWKDYFDFLLYLDCPRDIRFSRESEDTQKNIAKFENRYWKAEEFYLKHERPKEQADLVLLSES